MTGRTVALQLTRSAIVAAGLALGLRWGIHGLYDRIGDAMYGNPRLP